MQHSTLYTTDAKGKVRVWSIEQDGPSYRSETGLEDGAKTLSGWIHCSPKNIGKSNETTSVQQANLEVAALYVLKQKANYFLDRDDAAKKTFISPMLAQKYKDKPPTPADFAHGVYVQPKLDGIRAIVTANDIRSRDGREITSVPHIYEALKDLSSKHDVVFDGELYNHDFKENFNEIVSIVQTKKPTAEDFEKSLKSIQYHIYDLAILNTTFSDRSAFIKELLSDVPHGIEIVETQRVHNEMQVDTIFSGYVEEGYEGLMVRRDALYENKRSKNLLKKKDYIDEEFILRDIQEGSGVWSGRAKRVICFDPVNNVEFDGGVKGTFDFTTELLTNKDQYIGKEVTIRYFNRTPANKPRFGVATAFWPKGKI